MSDEYSKTNIERLYALAEARRIEIERLQGEAVAAKDYMVTLSKSVTSYAVTIDKLQGEVERHKATVQSALAQLLEARAILSSGTAYEKLCAVAILDNGLAQLLELDSE